MARRSHHPEKFRHHAESASPHDEIGSLDGGGTEAAPEIVMFFLGPDGEFLDEDPHAVPHHTLADVRRAWHAALESEAAHDPFARNRLGPRPVQGTGRPAKTGYRDEIVVTARSGPERSVAVAVRPGLFSPPVSRLTVDESSITSRRYELAWDARITLWPWQRRPVRLRLYASPSLNVTVLSLSPPKARAASAAPVPARRQPGDERVARPSRHHGRGRHLIAPRTGGFRAPARRRWSRSGRPSARAGSRPVRSRRR